MKKRMFRIGSIATDEHSNPGRVEVSDRWLSEHDLIKHLTECRFLLTIKPFVADVKSVNVCDNCGSEVKGD